MNEQHDRPSLVLGATGKTGARVIADLVNRGITVRTAARSGADVRFDWNERDSYAPALKATDRVYLLAPIVRLDFAADVSAFLDEAESAGVQHVTFLSAYGMEHAPEQVATRSVELDLAVANGSATPSCVRRGSCRTSARRSSSRSTARSLVPTGDGAEAFIDAEDIAAVAATTLADPAAHAGAAYTLTGPQALTVAEAAAILSDEPPARPSRTSTSTATPGSPARSPPASPPTTAWCSGN